MTRTIKAAVPKKSANPQTKPGATPSHPSRGSLSAPRRSAPRTAVGPIQLYGWQLDALAAWRSLGYRGVIEAVTGTGKTVVGLAAAADVLEDGAKVQVLVPSVELLRQWTSEIRRLLPGAAVAQLGDGADASLITCDVLVSVVNSARRYEARRLPPGSLLIADECHRYGSAENAKALNEGFQRRLGISATYARLDEGNATYLDPYFGEMCFRVGYARAIADDITARFKVALLGVRFAPLEQLAYVEASQKASDARLWLISAGVPAEPFGEFMKHVAQWSEGGYGLGTIKARVFLQRFAEKRAILAETLAKRQKLRELAPALAAADRSILFTQTIEAAEHATAVVRASRISAEAVHSGLGSDERRDVLTRFGKGHLKVISAPQVLDEGIDVPAADLAVILAASQTRRQMIQRMGRVLRRKADDRLARFVILYVQGTSEDPASGAHEAFLDEVTSVADEVRRFDIHASSTNICEFLNDYTSRRKGSPRRATTIVPASGAAFAAGGRVPPNSGAKRVRGSQSAPTPHVGHSSEGLVPEKLSKKERDAREARRIGCTVEQLYEARRAEAARNLLLHQLAKKAGISVKELRRRGAPGKADSR